MALIAMTVADTVEFVSDKDPAKSKKPVPLDASDPSKGEIIRDVIGEGATVFFLKPLDVFLMGYIYDNASTLSGKQDSNEIGIHTRVNQTNIDAVRHGLAGLLKPACSSVVVASRCWRIHFWLPMNMFGIQLIQELATRVKEISEVSAEEEKN